MSHRNRGLSVVEILLPWVEPCSELPSHLYHSYFWTPYWCQWRSCSLFEELTARLWGFWIDSAPLARQLPSRDSLEPQKLWLVQYCSRMLHTGTHWQRLILCRLGLTDHQWFDVTVGPSSTIECKEAIDMWIGLRQDQHNRLRGSWTGSIEDCGLLNSGVDYIIDAASSVTGGGWTIGVAALEALSWTFVACVECWTSLDNTGVAVTGGVVTIAVWGIVDSSTLVLLALFEAFKITLVPPK